MALEKYNEKRDFTKTQEPKGIRKPSKGQLRFVVQKHAASRLHYDFRLEINGVLASWAVPKGPSGNPADRRLAMHVEDHPMGYIDFEGTIPQGEYGGGTVMVWDIGTYHAEGNDDVSKDNTLMKKQWADGSIKIVLDGEKLKGAWHLVEMKGKDRQWLLMKAKDAHSGPKIEYNPYSILTGRDFDAIAKGDNVWKSNRKPDKAAAKKSTKEKSPKAVKSSPPAASKKKASDKFNAEDLADAKKLKTFPIDWSPQLATLADEPFDNEDWIFETKFDGYRALANIQNKNVNLVSRNGLGFNSKYPEIVKALEGTSADMILDGEIVIEDDIGKSQFQWLQNRNEKPKRGTLKFYVFDILYFSGFNLTQLELVQRKKILKAILPKSKNIVYSEHETGSGIQAFEKAEKAGGEGVIAKKAGSKYNVNKRSRDWLKIKSGKQQEMVIGGFTEPQGGRKGIGALLCGYYEGKEFRFSGKVGTGFTESILTDLRKKLDKLERTASPFAIAPKERGIHWVQPKLVAQIKFSEFTETNMMRHPVYLGLRVDKKAADVIMEKPRIETEHVPGSTTVSETQAKKPAAKKAPAPKKSDVEKSKVSKAKSTTKETGTAAITDSKVEFTNLDKLFWPKEKITKGDVINYYNSMANYILPYLIDRPQSLRRTPDGIKSQGFFQKNVAGAVPKWIKTKKIKSDSASESVEWLLCQDRDTLLFLANWGCIEMNPWSSRVGSLDNPDYIIFDLDPKGAPMKNIIKTALKVKEILDQLHVPGYIKTSGGNGLHVFIPVEPKYTYEQTRAFSHLISQMVNRDLPKITSLERMPNKRQGMVYLDFLQNGRGKTMASIYSLRPREGAGVSTPLEWDEINDSLDLKAFNLKTIPKRLAEKGDLWQGIFDNRLDLKKILQKM